MSNLRKLKMEDLLDITKEKEYKNDTCPSSIYISKNQKDFGHKKRIKPWRTGTKSQQQIVPKGFNKGFRG